MMSCSPLSLDLEDFAYYNKLQHQNINGFREHSKSILVSGETNYLRLGAQILKFAISFFK
jgi:hypothetical protein